LNFNKKWSKKISKNKIINNYGILASISWNSNKWNLEIRENNRNKEIKKKNNNRFIDK